MLTAILLAIVAFAATNIDNLFVLLAFFAEADDKRTVVSGQYVGSMALVALACGLASLMLKVPHAYIGLVGIMPIVIGIGKLLQAARTQSAQGSQEPLSLSLSGGETLSAPRAASSIWTVAVVAIANGSDNLSAYVPLFAGRPTQDAAVIIVVFLVMIGLWCGLANWLVSHRLIGKPISRYGHLLLPWVLILIGISVIAANGTLKAFGL